jgi:hypothetical protein
VSKKSEKRKKKTCALSHPCRLACLAAALAGRKKRPLTSLYLPRSTLKRAAPASPTLSSPIKFARHALFGSKPPAKATAAAAPGTPTFLPPGLAISARALDACTSPPSPPSPPLQAEEMVVVMTDEEEDGASELAVGAGETRRRLDFHRE